MLVVGNWKMYGDATSNQKLLNDLLPILANTKQVEVAVCAPFVYLAQLQEILGENNLIKYGAQDVSAHVEGAYTGQVSAKMLAELGCEYAIIGHSERRQFCRETDAEIAQKFKQLLACGLKPILCVGETKAERDAGIAEEVVAKQLQIVLELVAAAGFKDAVIAYEPVWAIGTGVVATPEQAQAMHKFLRNELAKLDFKLAEKVKILYGGSVKAANAAELFSQPDIDGGLIGGASLIAAEFGKICNIAAGIEK